MLQAAPLDRFEGIAHGFFDRTGGLSSGIYASLNCGTGSDDPDTVERNRALAMARLELRGESLVTCHQVHSAHAVVVQHAWSRHERPRADAMATNRPGICLGILTADCTPVLLADPQAGVIGAAHAGWRGAAGGILAAVVEAMISLGADVSRIVAAVGPAIQQPSYEVGPEFPKQFADGDAFFAPAQREGHHLFDLPGYVVRRLHNLGLSTVSNAGLDTYALEDRYFSYRRATRRGEPDYGRCLSAVALR